MTTVGDLVIHFLNKDCTSVKINRENFSAFMAILNDKAEEIKLDLVFEKNKVKIVKS